MLAEIWVVFQRQMRSLLRNPVWLVFGLMQPVLFLVLFGPLVRNVTGGGLGGDSTWNIFVPGILLQLVIFGAGFAGFGVIQELREGVIDRQRVTPARRSSLILGRTLQNTVTIGVQGVLLVLVAVPLGLRPSWTGVVLAVLLVCLLALGLSAASYSVGLILKDEDSFAPIVQGVTLPLMLLSGLILPMSLAPGWLGALSRVNPLTYTVDGARALFRGDLASGDVFWGVVVTAALAALLAAWGTRTFQRSNS